MEILRSIAARQLLSAVRKHSENKVNITENSARKFATKSESATETV